jgi:hypothetical protein
VALRVEKSGYRIEPPTSETDDRYWVREVRPVPRAAARAEPARNWR